MRDPVFLRLDYKWLTIGFAAFVTIVHTVLAVIFNSDSEIFLSTSYVVVALILLVSSSLYSAGNRVWGYFGSSSVVAIFLFLFYYYTGFLFEFTGSDSIMYYEESISRLDLSLKDALQDFVKNTKYGWDDTGMIIYSYLTLSFFKSILFQRTINFVLLIVQASLMRGILKRLGIENYVINLCLALYISNSVVLYFTASGLKEALFTTIIIAIWYFFSGKKGSVRRSLALLISVSSLYLFRIPELILTLLALLIKQSKKYFILLIFPLLGFVVFLFYAFYDVLYWYAIRGDQDVEVARNMGFIYKLSVYASGLFGPFATFSSAEDQRDTLMYGMGLSTIMVLRLYIIFSFKYVLKNLKVLAPFIAHIVLHIIVLIIIDRTLKIRYWMPVIPAIFICFAFILDLTEKKGLVSLRLLLSNLVTVVWLTFWNILRYN